MATTWAAFRPCCGRRRWGPISGWNVTAAGFDKGKICMLNGGFIPFAKTKAERLASGDPRPSLEERYGNHALCGGGEGGGGEGRRRTLPAARRRGQLIAEAAASDVLVEKK